MFHAADVVLVACMRKKDIDNATDPCYDGVMVLRRTLDMADSERLFWFIFAVLCVHTPLGRKF